MCQYKRTLHATCGAWQASRSSGVQDHVSEGGVQHTPTHAALECLKFPQVSSNFLEFPQIPGFTVLLERKIMRALHGEATYQVRERVRMCARVRVCVCAFVCGVCADGWRGPWVRACVGPGGF